MYKEIIISVENVVSIVKKNKTYYVKFKIEPLFCGDASTYKLKRIYKNGENYFIKSHGNFLIDSAIVEKIKNF